MHVAQAPMLKQAARVLLSSQEPWTRFLLFPRNVLSNDGRLTYAIGWGFIQPYTETDDAFKD